jgi:hypothetical protein
VDGLWLGRCPNNTAFNAAALACDEFNVPVARYVYKLGAWSALGNDFVGPTFRTEIDVDFEIIGLFRLAMQVVRHYRKPLNIVLS